MLCAACLCAHISSAPIVPHVSADSAQAVAQGPQSKAQTAALRGLAHGPPDKHPAEDIASAHAQLVARQPQTHTRLIWHISDIQPGIARAETWVKQLLLLLPASVRRTWQTATASSDVCACSCGMLSRKAATPQARSPLQARCNPAPAQSAISAWSAVLNGGWDGKTPHCSRLRRLMGAASFGCLPEYPGTLHSEQASSNTWREVSPEQMSTASFADPLQRLTPSGAIDHRPLLKR